MHTMAKEKSSDRFAGSSRLLSIYRLSLCLPCLIAAFRLLTSWPLARVLFLPLTASNVGARFRLISHTVTLSLSIAITASFPLSASSPPPPSAHLLLPLSRFNVYTLALCLSLGPIGSRSVCVALFVPSPHACLQTACI